MSLIYTKLFDNNKLNSIKIKQTEHNKKMHISKTMPNKP